MNLDDEAMREEIYRHFARTGRPPKEPYLAATLHISPDEVRESQQRLAEARHVVLDKGGKIVMAHPFAAIPLGFGVMGTSNLWWGGCAWDSFAMPHLLTSEPDVLVSTRCPGCDAALAWVVGRDAPPAGEHVAHFLVPMAHVWDDVVWTCSNQRLFCSTSCVDSWLRRTGHERGYVMDLATLWTLARRWYEGRLEHGYRRREPVEAADYFREAGLSGSFWGL